MLVSAVVLNYNGAWLLPDCLASLRAQSYSPLELLVVDNASTDGSRAVAEEYGVRFESMEGNLGLAPANNRGGAVARGELVFFVNNDMRFDAQCVAHLVEPLQRDDGLFATDPLQFDWAGTRVVHRRTALRRAGLWRSVFPGLRVDYLGEGDIPAEVPWGCAGSLMVRRDRFLALGGFDPTFFLDFEDADLCWRAWRMGWPTLFVPHARLWHRVAATDHARPGRPDGKSTGWRRQLSSRKNAQRFALKLFEPWRAALTLAMFALKAAREVATGRADTASLTLRSLALNAREMGEILALRRELNGKSIWATESLIERFLAEEGWP